MNAKKKIECKLCNNEYYQLIKHIPSHKISVEKYCDIFGVSRNDLFGFTISYDKIYNDYIVENKSMNKLCDEYKLEIGDIRTILNSYKIVKDMKSRVKANEKTKEDRYGDKHYNNLKLIKETMNERFGVDCIFNNKEFIDYNVNKQKELYGGIGTSSDITKEKIVKTNLTRYGVEFPFQSKDIHNKTIQSQCVNNSGVGLASASIANKYRQTMIERYGTQTLKTSSYETELQCYIESIYSGDIRTNVRDIISPYELDIYIPEKNVAIEFNGTYWHSLLQKEKDYHYKKSSLCEEKGIRLIHIWEYEWLNERQRPILENIIKSALGVVDNRIYARKCNIVIKKSAEMKDFFNTNNIQGFRGGKFSICLEYNDEIVMAYQMGNAFFGKGKYEWEVIRGATKLNTTVVGGASKIWKYFVETYKPKSCVYYIDYNYFNGSSVEKLGLKYITSQQSFKNYWVQEDVVRNREPQRHREIKELEKQGLVVPIYNAGTKVYIYESNN